MTEFEIEIAADADDDDVTALREALFEFNRQATGYDDGRSLSCFLRDDRHRLVAGIDGFTWGGYARVDLLWVDETLRGTGLGRALVEAAEQEARARGCATIVLDTHEFQAPDFYRKLGYEQIGKSEDTPAGFRQFLFQKRLDAPTR